MLVHESQVLVLFALANFLHLKQSIFMFAYWDPEEEFSVEIWTIIIIV